MSAAFTDRHHAQSVEAAMEGLAITLGKAEQIDTREDELVRRIHVAVHRLEQIDREEDAVRGELAACFREIAGLLDGKQMRLGELA